MVSRTIKAKISELHELLEDETDSRLQELRNYLYDVMDHVQNDEHVANITENEDEEAEIKPKVPKSTKSALFD